MKILRVALLLGVYAALYAAHLILWARLVDGGMIAPFRRNGDAGLELRFDGFIAWLVSVALVTLLASLAAYRLFPIRTTPAVIWLAFISFVGLLLSDGWLMVAVLPEGAASSWTKAVLEYGSEPWFPLLSYYQHGWSAGRFLVVGAVISTIAVAGLIVLARSRSLGSQG